MRDALLLAGPMRAPFLVLTPACIFLGVATALWEQGRVEWFSVALVLIGALGAHISVNSFNEYFDFKSGLDLTTTRTPFSGGSGTLPANPHLWVATLITAWIGVAATAAVGFYFVVVKGLWPVVPIGLAGLAFVYGYTVWIVRRPLLCLLAPGLGFGTFMVMGTHVALTGHYSWPAFIASLIPFFLVCNLLLLNQFPDVEPDRLVGRRHLMILCGTRIGGVIYALFNGAAFATVIAGVILFGFGLWSLLGLLTAALALPVSVGVLRHGDDLKRLVSLMGLNVVVDIATPVLVGIGLLLK